MKDSSQEAAEQLILADASVTILSSLSLQILAECCMLGAAKFERSAIRVEFENINVDLSLGNDARLLLNSIEAFFASCAAALRDIPDAK